MANIILEPNEVFEHKHESESFTILLDGAATFEIEGQKVVMELNRPYVTPAKTMHVMTNIGNDNCVLKCGLHKPPDIKK